MTSPRKYTREQFVSEFRDLFTSGALRIEGNEIVGVAADGCEVQIGNDWDWGRAAEYLRNNRTPDKW